METIARRSLGIVAGACLLSGCQSWFLTVADDKATIKHIQELQIELREYKSGLEHMERQPETPPAMLDKQRARIRQTQKDLDELVHTLPPEKQKELGYEPAPKPFTDPAAAPPSLAKPDPANPPGQPSSAAPVTGSKYGGTSSGAGTPHPDGK